jgi:hypothetical protein
MPDAQPLVSVLEERVFTHATDVGLHIRERPIVSM